MRFSRALLALTVISFATVQTFNPERQRISTSGKRKFVPPNFKKGDERGPCPALNDLSNHGYLPHNGVASIQQFVTATNTVFGLALDLGSFLSIYGALVIGNSTHFCIGGPTSLLDPPKGPFGDIVYTPLGLARSHNRYESDASPTREDLYVSGNASTLVLKYFEQLYSRQPDNASANYDINTVFNHMGDRRKHSIATNPYLFFPFFGIFASPAAYSFIAAELMKNHSAEHPNGRLNGDVMKTFYSVTGKKGNFKYTVGHERIPDNWYRRPQTNEYSIPLFFADLSRAAAKNPIMILNFGGNTGRVNTFTGIDVGNLTGGVYNGRTLAENDNFACFEWQIMKNFPQFIALGLRQLLGVNRMLLESLAVNTSRGFECPELERFDMTQLTRYPGYLRSRADE